MTATPRTALRGLYDPCRTMEEYMQERMSRADLLNAHSELAHEIGAYKAFNQCAGIAKDALTAMRLARSGA